MDFEESPRFGLSAESSESNAFVRDEICSTRRFSIGSFRELAPAFVALGAVALGARRCPLSNTARRRKAKRAAPPAATEQPVAMPMPEARGDPPAGQSCLDVYSTAGEWKNGEAWTVPSAGAGCPAWRQFTSAQAQTALRGQHLMVVGDLHARLFYSALIYLVNGTATPNDVAPGYMRHKWEVGSPCAWNAGKQAKGWYDWAGWGEVAARLELTLPQALTRLL